MSQKQKTGKLQHGRTVKYDSEETESTSDVESCSPWRATYGCTGRESFENNSKPIVTRQSLSRRATHGLRFEKNIKRVSLVAEASGATHIAGR